MIQVTISPGDTLSAIASQYLGDSSKWREIAEVAGINPLEDLEIGATINLPDIKTYIDKTESVLSDISVGLNRVSSMLQKTSEIPAIGGYAKAALAQIDKVNGVVSRTGQVLDDVALSNSARNYSGSVELIDWLL